MMKFVICLFYTVRNTRRKYFFLFFISCIFLSQLFNCSTILKDTDFLRKKNVKQALKEYQSESWLDRKKAVEKIVHNIRGDNNKFIVIPLIIAMNDSHNAIRVQALKGLGMIQSPEALKAIKNFIHTQKDSDIKWTAIKTLLLFKDPSSVNIFIEGMTSEDWLIREASVKGLLSINDASIQEKIVPYVIKALNDKNESVKIAALKNLHFRSRTVYETLNKNFLKVKNSQYTLMKAYLLALKGFILDEKTRRKVINLLTHPNKEIRIYALRVLKKEKITKKFY